eukprot:1365034-Amorphochlora_amoeboformis.AAC.1
MTHTRPAHKYFGHADSRPTTRSLQGMPRTVASPGSKETPDGVRPTPSNTGLREKTGIASNCTLRTLSTL